MASIQKLSLRRMTLGPTEPIVRRWNNAHHTPLIYNVIFLGAEQTNFHSEIKETLFAQTCFRFASWKFQDGCAKLQETSENFKPSFSPVSDTTQKIFHFHQNHQRFCRPPFSWEEFHTSLREKKYPEIFPISLIIHPEWDIFLKTWLWKIVFGGNVLFCTKFTQNSQRARFFAFFDAIRILSHSRDTDNSKNR